MYWYTVYHLDASADSVIVYPVHRQKGTSLDIVSHVTGFEMCDIYPTDDLKQGRAETKTPM